MEATEPGAVLPADEGRANDDAEQRVLARTNALLGTLGFGDRSFARAADLVASVSSMSVALYEKLFQFRLRDVVRVPRTLQDYEHNAQLVVDALAGALLEPAGEDAHARSRDQASKPLTGRRLCSGDWRAILQLVERLEQVYAILYDGDGTFRGGALAVGVGNELQVPVGETIDAPLSARTKTRSRLSSSASEKAKAARKVKRRSGSTLAAKRRPVYSSESDGDSGAEREKRLPRRPRDHRTAPSTRAHGNESERKQTEVRRSGVVDTAVRSRASVSHLSSSSSSSSPSSPSSPSRGSGERRLARSLMVEQRAQVADPLSKSTSSMQTRSQKDAKLEVSTRLGSSRSQLRSEKANRLAQSASTRRSIAASSEERAAVDRDHQDTESDLLQTRKYGRFVGSDTPKSRSTRARSASTLPHDAIEPPPFGDLSSVSIASKGSQHFLDEGTGLEHDFSAISIESARFPGRAPSDDEAEGNFSVLKQSGASGRSRRSAQQSRSVHPNQRDAASEAGEDDMEESGGEGGGGDDATGSPVRKKLVRDAPEAPRLSSSPRVTQHNAQAPSLHPLLPRSKARGTTSKAQAEYLRYKLTLKNHLQQLRQRELCQRQHMERAYKAGEHTANVDKIRARRFEQDIRLQRIAIGLEAKEEEEKQLRHAMHHLLDLEKEKLREEHRVTSSVLKQIQKDHEEREQAMENFYANQIRIVREQTEREALERELMEKAQRQASEQMMREMRHQRETQLTALLQEKQQLAEARRFRQAAQMTQLLERTDQKSAARTDAFYTAAMRARHRRAEAQSGPPSQQLRQRQRQPTASAYRSTSAAGRPLPSAAKAKAAPLQRSARVY